MNSCKKIYELSLTFLGGTMSRIQVPNRAKAWSRSTNWLNCQHREKHRVDVKMMNTDSRCNENKGQMKRHVIEYFPVHKSYPKHFAGDVLGMIILLMWKKYFYKIYKIFSMSSREAVESLKISLIWPFCLKIKVLTDFIQWFKKKTWMLYFILFEIPWWP